MRMASADMSQAELVRADGQPAPGPLHYASVEALVEERKPEEPIFCVRPSELRAAALRFRNFPGRVLYAVKCNPHPYVLRSLFQSGINDFDVASLDEIALVAELFGRSAGQFFNNPAKSREAIRAAAGSHGVRFFTVDCAEEVHKVLAEAGNPQDLIIAVRLTTAARDARYVLSTKFGAQVDDAVEMLRLIHRSGARAGLSFHVGSQCLSPDAFSAALHNVGRAAKKAGVPLAVLNVGGGFPAPYPGDAAMGVEHYFARIIHGRRELELSGPCMLMCEPGRALVATCASVLLQVTVRRGDALFLNDGVFGTLQELGNPKEKRPLRLIKGSGRASTRMRDFKIYGPTCDSNDVLGAPFSLPENTSEGDWIEVGMMGAYSWSMRTRFNGFHADELVTLES